MDRAPASTDRFGRVVASTKAPVVVDGAPVDVPLARAEPATVADRLVIWLRGLRAPAHPGAYDVYLLVPGRQDSRAPSPLGRVTYYGPIRADGVGPVDLSVDVTRARGLVHGGEPLVLRLAPVRGHVRATIDSVALHALVAPPRVS